MKKICLTLLFGFFFFNLSVNAQPPVRTETAAERNERWARERQAASQEAAGLQAKIRAIGTKNNPSYQVRQIRFERRIKLLYRDPTEEELAAISPNAEDTKKYADFLQQSGMGLIKLVVDLGCAEDTRIVVATPECLKYTMPGAGSSYSFRTENYRIRRLADIIYIDNSFQSAGVLLQGIFVKIGDVPLENVNLQTKGLKFLVNFQPEPNREKVRELDRKLSEGIISDGFQYRRGLSVTENTTYVLRSIAYNGLYQGTAEGMAYNELDFDKRQDIIVAFRVVRRDSDGSVTILWKELQRKDPPKFIQKNSKKSDLANRKS